MRTIDRGVNWHRKARNYGIVSLVLGAGWLLIQSGLG